MTTKFWLYVVLHGVLVLGGLYLVDRQVPSLQSVGGSLIATGVAGWVIFLYVLKSSRTAERIALVETTGLREAFPSRSVSIPEKYEERLRKARSQIDVIGFGLRALREDFTEEFSTWAARANVRIVLLDPEFPSSQNSLAGIRDIEEGNPEDSIHNDVRAFVEDTKDLVKSNSRFHIRLYRAIPSVNYFRIDDEAFWGPYFIGTQSRNTPTFLISRSGTLFAPLAGHFEKLWSDDRFSREIPEEWFSEA